MIRLQTDPSHVNKFFHSLALVAINTSQFRLEDPTEVQNGENTTANRKRKKNKQGWVGGLVQ